PRRRASRTCAGRSARPADRPRAAAPPAPPSPLDAEPSLPVPRRGYASRRGGVNERSAAAVGTVARCGRHSEPARRSGPRRPGSGRNWQCANRIAEWWDPRYTANAETLEKFAAARSSAVRTENHANRDAVELIAPALR